jgi:hypothetical protein
VKEKRCPSLESHSQKGSWVYELGGSLITEGMKGGVEWRAGTDGKLTATLVDQDTQDALRED